MNKIQIQLRKLFCGLSLHTFGFFPWNPMQKVSRGEWLCHHCFSEANESQADRAWRSAVRRSN